MPATSKEFSIELGDRTVTVLVDASGYFEPNYGSDADGNRGIPAWFLDDFEYDIPDDDDDGESLSETDKLQVESQLNTLLESHDWDVDESDEDEVDDD